MERPKRIACLFVSLAGVALNIVVCRFLRDSLGTPLYLDTVFTMTVTFYSGLYWGVLTGAITNLLLHSVWFFGWPLYLYTLCNVAVAIVTAQFITWFPRELDIFAQPKPAGKKSKMQDLMETVIILVILSFALCVVISILGGFFATLIEFFRPTTSSATDPEINFKLALLRKGLPLILVEIGSRIPVNILDRLVSSFVGYGTAFLLSRITQRTRKSA